MKFYHVADVHLGAVPDRGMPWSTMREKDMFESFYRLLAQAHRERIDAVLICGDLFHRQPLKKELKELAYYFEKAAPVKIFIIAGNHDYISAESNYVNFPWSSNVIFIASGECRRIVWKEQQVCIYGFSYHSREITEPLYDHLTPRDASAHILMAHGGDEKHIPIHWETLARAGFDYVALGHIHKPWLSADGRMAYCGALEPVDKNDEGPHGFIEGEICGHQVRTRFVPWAKWSYVNLEVETVPSMPWGAIKDQTSKLMSQAQHKNGEAIYKIMLKGSKDAQTAGELQELYTLGRVVSVTDARTYDFDFDSLYEANRGNLLGRYIEKVRALDVDEETRKKILYYGFNALYQTGEQP